MCISVYHKGTLIGAISCRLEPLDAASETIKIHNQANASAQAQELCVPAMPSQPVAASNIIVNNNAKREIDYTVDSSSIEQGDSKRHKSLSSIPAKPVIDAVTVAKILATSQLQDDHHNDGMLLASHADEQHTVSSSLSEVQQPNCVATQASAGADINIDTAATATASSHNSNCSKLYIMTLGVAAAYRYH